MSEEPKEMSGIHCVAPKTKEKHNMNKLSLKREHELAEALDRYTDPNYPEYDAKFDAEIRRIRPDWFDKQE